MHAPEIERAVAAATSLAAELDLAVSETMLLHNSNKLALRLLPCDVVARVAPVGEEVAQFELDIAGGLADVGSPVAALEPRVEPRAYERDGFVVTFWTHYEAVAPHGPRPGEVASALEQLHAGMRALDVAAPHFMDRVAEAANLVADRALTPALADADRALLDDTLRHVSRWITQRGAPEQLLHGEPHPGNVLSTGDGLRFIDFETCCRGPVEFDLAHVPTAVSERYENVDKGLLHECRRLVLAMVAAWRWDPGDQFPGRERAGRDLLSALRNGPPWPTLDEVMSAGSTSSGSPQEHASG